MGSLIEGADLEPHRRLRQAARPALEAVPNVKTVVPMGISGALVTSGNTDRPRAERAARLCTASATRPRRRGADGLDDARSPTRRPTSARSSRCCRPTWQGHASVQDEKAMRPGGRGRGRAGRLRRVLGRVRPRSARAARVPGEPHRAPGHRRGHVVPALRRAPTSSLPQVLRPHEDRRRARHPAGAARLPVRQVHLRGAGQAEDRAPARQDQGGPRRPQARPSPTTRSCSGSCARTAAAGARAAAAARRPQDRRCSAASCRRSSASERGRRRQAAGRVLQDGRRQLRRAATSSSTTSWRRCWSSTGCGSATRSTIKAFTKSGYVQSVNLQGLRHLQLPGAREVAAGRRAQPDGPGLLPRALRLPDRRQDRRRSPRCKAAAGAKEVTRENAEAELFGSQWTTDAPTRRRGHRRGHARDRRRRRPRRGLAGRLRPGGAGSARVYDPKRARSRAWCSTPPSS